MVRRIEKAPPGRAQTQPAAEEAKKSIYAFETPALRKFERRHPGLFLPGGQHRLQSKSFVNKHILAGWPSGPYRPRPQLENFVGRPRGRVGLRIVHGNLKFERVVSHTSKALHEVQRIAVW